MRVLIGCERSGVVRRAFREMGHDAYSCDVWEADDGSAFHYQEDVRAVVEYGWDLAIFHPPCTRLTVAGARWFRGKEEEQAEAIAFVEYLWSTEIKKIAIENPIGVLSTRSKLGKPTQIVQPWWFGHGETKATCLWLRGLPPLQATKIVTGRKPRVHYESPGIVEGKTRQQRRSEALPGFAQAMARQWG